MIKRVCMLMVLCLGVFAAEANEVADSLRIKAEAGNVQAMNYLGYLLLSGEDGVTPDLTEGIKWLTRAATAGDVKAASNLGWLLVDGTLVEKDLPAGIRWLRKAADAGLPVALSLLGDLHRNGIGLERDSVAADSLYRRAFEGGLADAGYKLYDLRSPAYAGLTPAEKVTEGKYFYLRGAPSEGVKLFYSASDDGDALAMALLGDAYSRAVGVPYDHDLSIYYFVKAAAAGNPSAQFVVGELLDIFPDSLDRPEWEQLPKDPLYWYEEAASAGVTDAAIASQRLLQ